MNVRIYETCHYTLEADNKVAVVSATVNVVCELTRKNPKNYLPLAPQLFKLLTSSSNNWMTIKIIKLVSIYNHTNNPKLTRYSSRL